MDSTAVTTYMQCPRKYFYRMVLGYSADVQMPYFAFGSAYHLFREVLERAYMADPLESNWTDYILAALDAASKYCDKHLKPVDDPKNKWAFMTKDRLIKSCVFAANHWKAEKKSGRITVLSIEQPFQIALPDGRIIAGRADQVINLSGKIWGRDFKTSSTQGNYYVNSLNPNDQFTRYTYAENKLVGWDESDINDRPKVEGQMIEVLFNAKTVGPTLETYPAQRTRSELLMWLKEQEVWHKQMQINRDTDVWPMNTKSCTFCEFRKVCDLPNETSQMSQLKRNYKHSPWDCTRSEGDGKE